MNWDDDKPLGLFKESMKILLAIIIYVLAAMFLVKFGHFLFEGCS